MVDLSGKEKVMFWLLHSFHILVFDMFNIIISLFISRSVFDLKHNQRFDTPEKTVCILSIGDLSGEIQPPSTAYLSVLPHWFAFNESVVRLKRHEPIPLKTFVACNQWQKSIFPQPAISHNYFCESGQGVGVVYCEGDQGQSMPFNKIFSQAIFSLALGVQVLLL